MLPVLHHVMERQIDKADILCLVSIQLALFHPQEKPRIHCTDLRIKQFLQKLYSPASPVKPSSRRPESSPLLCSIRTVKQSNLPYVLFLHNKKACKADFFSAHYESSKMTV